LSLPVLRFTDNAASATETPVYLDSKLIRRNAREDWLARLPHEEKIHPAQGEKKKNDAFLSLKGQRQRTIIHCLIVKGGEGGWLGIASRRTLIRSRDCNL
jgi:hypothetical protein